MAARSRGLAGRVLGIGRNEERLRLAAELGAIDDYTTDFAAGARACDLLYLATPVFTIIEQIQTLSRLDGCSCVVTDGGSVKQAIVDAARALPDAIRFVGGHPMAGSEEGGVGAASPKLYDGAPYVLTPDETTDTEALALVRALAEGAGARAILMDPETHDRVVARTSHLPHILSSAFLRAAQNAGPEARCVTAGSFRDLTRVADSSPELWRDICCANSTEILQALEDFRASLDTIGELVADCDADGVRRWFEEGRALHDRIVKKKEDQG